MNDTPWTLSKQEVDALLAFHKWGNEVFGDEPAVGSTVIVLETGERGEVTSINADFQHSVFVTFIPGGTRMYAPEEVEVYEAAAVALAPELPEPLEVLGVGDMVFIERDYGRRGFYARVECIYEELGCVQVWHAQGGYYAGVWAVEDVKLIEKVALASEEASA